MNQLRNVGFIPRDSRKCEAHVAHPKVQQDDQSASTLSKNELMSASSPFTKLQEGSRRRVSCHEELEDLSYNRSDCRNCSRCEKTHDHQQVPYYSLTAQELSLCSCQAIVTA